MISKKKVKELLDQMEELFPDASCELNYENEFELVIAVLLSAQTTDKSVNKLTEQLFKKYKTPEDFDKVSLTELEQDIKTIGLYRNKAKSIKRLAKQLIENYESKVPSTFEELVELGGVGRKTANVVLSVGFDVPRIAVDTHVERVSKRLGICPQKDTVLEVEKKLMHLIPEERWSKAHHVFIHFGRYHCTAKNPKCEQCPLVEACKTGEKLLKA
ncbi:MAG TPA: endonuclease III [Firmicutes bacterium]|nr:endonuclease III [Bacillota bacterium]